MARPEVGDQQNDYALYREFDCGLQQRARAVNGCGKWPKTNKIWESGIAGAITDNEDGTLTMVDASPVVPPPVDPGDPPEIPIKDWSMPPGSGLCPTSGASKWVGFHDECSCYIPDFYDVVFEVGGEWDETAIVRGQITSHTVGGTEHPSVTFSDVEIKNAVVAGFIASVDAIAGSEYAFVKRNGMYWSDVNTDHSKRMPFPNDPELWRDYATAGSDKFLRAPFNRAVGVAAAQSWRADEWAGCEVLARDGGGYLHRLTVVWNDADALYFVPKPDPEDPPEDQMPPGWVDPSPAHALSGVFCIVEPGNKCDPQRWSPQPGAWNTGAKRSLLSHYPGDRTTTAVYGGAGDVHHAWLVSHDAAATNVQWDEGTPCNPGTPGECETVNHPKPPNSGHAYDEDLWSADDEECGAPAASDRNYSPRWFWSIGGRQRECVRLCVFYLDHTNLSPGAMDTFTPATYFHALGFNAGTSAVVEESDNVFTAAVDAKYNGYRLWWTVKNANGTVRFFGQAYAAAGKIGLSADLWNATEAAIDPANRTNDVGKTVVYSAGFTRGDANGHGPREVRRLYDKGPIFIPEVNVDALTGAKTVIDPANVVDFEESGCFGAGDYVFRPASATFLDHTEDGITTDGDDPIVDDVPFRYVGDNWHDPTVRASADGGAGGVVEPGTDEGNAAYWDRFYQGTHAVVPQSALESRRAGTVADDFVADGRSLRKSGTANLRASWFPGDVMRTETGTASGGSANTLVDNNKLTTDESGCFALEVARWPDGKPFVGLVLRVTSGDNAGLKRPITGAVVNTGTHTVTWTVLYDFPHAIDAGDDYAIDVPHEANQYQRRTLRVYDAAPATTFTDVIVSHHDGDTIWFDETFAPTPGAKWAIVEPRTGGVWVRTEETPPAGSVYVKLAGGKYYRPVAGDDSRGQPWHAESSENLPWLGPVKYGYANKGDYRTLQVLQELWDAINFLQAFTKDVSWTNHLPWNEDQDTNFRQAAFPDGGSFCRDIDPLYPDAQDSFDDFWSCVDEYIAAFWIDGSTFGCEGTCHSAGPTGDLPSAVSVAQADEGSDPDNPFSVFDTFVYRSYLYAVVEDVPTCMPVQVDVWAKAQRAFYFEGDTSDNVFDTLGDGDFAEDAWGLIISEGAGDDGTTSYVRVGWQGTPLPGEGPDTQPPLVKPVLDAGPRTRGYQITDAVAVLRPTFTCCVPPEP